MAKRSLHYGTIIKTTPFSDIKLPYHRVPRSNISSQDMYQRFANVEQRLTELRSLVLDVQNQQNEMAQSYSKQCQTLKTLVGKSENDAQNHQKLCSILEILNEDIQYLKENMQSMQSCLEHMESQWDQWEAFIKDQEQSLQKQLEQDSLSSQENAPDAPSSSKETATKIAFDLGKIEKEKQRLQQLEEDIQRELQNLETPLPILSSMQQMRSHIQEREKAHSINAYDGWESTGIELSSVLGLGISDFMTIEPQATQEPDNSLAETPQPDILTDTPSGDSVVGLETTKAAPAQLDSTEDYNLPLGLPPYAAKPETVSEPIEATTIQVKPSSVEPDEDLLASQELTENLADSLPENLSEDAVEPSLEETLKQKNWEEENVLFDRNLSIEEAPNKFSSEDDRALQDSELNGANGINNNWGQIENVISTEMPDEIITDSTNAWQLNEDAIHDLETPQNLDLMPFVPASEGENEDDGSENLPTNLIDLDDPNDYDLDDDSELYAFNEDFLRQNLQDSAFPQELSDRAEPAASADTLRQGAEPAAAYLQDGEFVEQNLHESESGDPLFASLNESVPETGDVDSLPDALVSEALESPAPTEVASKNFDNKEAALAKEPPLKTLEIAEAQDKDSFYESKSSHIFSEIIDMLASMIQQTKGTEAVDSEQRHKASTRLNHKPDLTNQALAILEELAEPSSEVSSSLQELNGYSNGRTQSPKISPTPFKSAHTDLPDKSSKPHAPKIPADSLADLQVQNLSELNSNRPPHSQDNLDSLNLESRLSAFHRLANASIVKIPDNPLETTARAPINVEDTKGPIELLAVLDEVPNGVEVVPKVSHIESSDTAPILNINLSALHYSAGKVAETGGISYNNDLDDDYFPLEDYESELQTLTKEETP